MSLVVGFLFRELRGSLPVPYGGNSFQKTLAKTSGPIKIEYLFKRVRSCVFNISSSRYIAIFIRWDRVMRVNLPEKMELRTQRLLMTNTPGK
jgi:hypothetical protein